MREVSWVNVQIMPKDPIYNAREQEVLDSPDGFRIIVTQEHHRIQAPYLYTAKEALETLQRLRNAHYRVQVYASRSFGTEERLASVTDAYISALVI